MYTTPHSMEGCQEENSGSKSIGGPPQEDTHNGAGFSNQPGSARNVSLPQYTFPPTPYYSHSPVQHVCNDLLVGYYWLKWLNLSFRSTQTVLTQSLISIATRLVLYTKYHLHLNPAGKVMDIPCTDLLLLLPCQIPILWAPLLDPSLSCSADPYPVLLVPFRHLYLILITRALHLSHQIPK